MFFYKYQLNINNESSVNLSQIESTSDDFVRDLSITKISEKNKFLDVICQPIDFVAMTTI